MPRPVYFSAHHLKYLLLAAILFFLWAEVEAQCGGTCSACAQRYGCRTPAWGKCCTQFYMHNGKRAGKPVLEGLIEYVKLKSRIVDQKAGDAVQSNGNEEFRTDDVTTSSSSIGSKSHIRNKSNRFLTRDIDPRLLEVFRRKSEPRQ